VKVCEEHACNIPPHQLENVCPHTVEETRAETIIKCQCKQKDERKIIIERAENEREEEIKRYAEKKKTKQ